MTELGIGEFSRVTGLTIKTIRFYHERGLLQPARVDVGSGYRYFDEANIQTARVIAKLRELEFSVDDISSMISGDTDVDLVSFLQTRKTEIENQIRSRRHILKKLDQIIRQEEQNTMLWESSKFEIEERSIESMLIAGIRVKGCYSDMTESFGKLGRALGRHIAGPAMCLLYDQEYRENDADFEPCFPMRKKISTPGIHVRELANATAICLTHQGPFEEIHRSYAKIFRYSREHNLTLLTPSREVYLKGPGALLKGNAKNYRTEIQLILTNAD